MRLRRLVVCALLTVSVGCGGCFGTIYHEMDPKGSEGEIAAFGLGEVVVGVGLVIEEDMPEAGGVLIACGVIDLVVSLRRALAIHPRPNGFALSYRF